MYIIKDYLTGETVAYATRKADAVAMIRTTLDDKRLIIEKAKQ